MKWLKRLLYFLVGFLGIFVVFYLVGLFVKKDYHVTKTIELPVAQAVVWQKISNWIETPTWRRDLIAIERLPDREGKPVYREKANYGPVTYVIEELVPPGHMKTRVVDHDKFTGTWIFELKPQGDGCLLTITSDGQIYNPIFRTMMRFVFGYGSSIKGYFEDLEETLGK